MTHKCDKLFLYRRVFTTSSRHLALFGLKLEAFDTTKRILRFIEYRRVGLAKHNVYFIVIYCLSEWSSIFNIGFKNIYQNT